MHQDQNGIGNMLREGVGVAAVEQKLKNVQTKSTTQNKLIVICQEN